MHSKSSIRNIFISLLILATTLLAETDWTHSYDEAKVEASSEGKLIMVMLSKESCDACWYMENIVFEDDEVKALVMSRFIPVYLDVNTDLVPAQFKYIGTPTFYFTDAEGKRIGHRLNGASNVKDFMRKLKEILAEAPKP